MFLLVPSPLLGPHTWRGVEAWLRRHGHDAQVVVPGPLPRTPTSVLDSVVAAAADRTVVLVPHSNAGYYAPHLSTLVDARATVYVDAALPSWGSEGQDTPLAPPAFLGFLQGLADDDDGLLPPWTEWWEDVSDLFPDSSTREAVEREQPRLPLTYFTSRVAVPAGWTGRRAAYVAFGETYAEERDRAHGLGWPTRTLVGGHLHMLQDPSEVGRAILELSRPDGAAVE